MATSVTVPGSSAARTSPPLLRRGIPGEKKPLKEKLITYYELLFEGKDPSQRKPQFWDEFFLLKVNVEYLSEVVGSLSIQKIVLIKRIFNTLFIQCCHTLQVDDNMIRNINALQTLCTLLRAVFQKKLSDRSFDVIDIIVGFDSAECQMRNLIESLGKFLAEDYPVSVKNLSLRLLLIMLTATDNVSQNVLLEYAMMNSIFEPVMQVLSHPEARELHGYDSMVVLALLINYRKYEAANPYVIKLSVLDDEIALNGLGCVVASLLMEYNRHYSMSGEQQPVGFFGQITSMFSNMLVPSEGTRQEVTISDAMLLSLYEAVNLNRNFITVLTHTQSASQPGTPVTPAPAVERSLTLPSTPTTPDGSLVPLPRQPTNLLGTFLTFSSIVLHNTKDERSVNHGHLCLVILTCIVEDQYANAFLHDPNITFPVTLYKASLQRKPKAETSPKSTTLACSLLDLMVDFLVTHLSKVFQLELYKKSIGIIHRMLCYQKRCKIRLTYNWKGLWNALVNVLKFFSTSEASLLQTHNIFVVADEIVKILNLFITYGDTFLPNPTTYDELYYELIRVNKVFDDLYTIGLRYTSPGNAFSDSATRFVSNVVNVRSIATHFKPKIDAWSASHEVISITPEQVLDVVRSNYDTLTLKLQDNLDHYEKYSEKSREAGFFTYLVRSVVLEVRGSITISSLQQMSVLNELSILS